MAPLTFGIIGIHTCGDCTPLQAFVIEKNDYIVSCSDHPMIGKKNYSPSTLPGPILAPLEFGVIVIYTHDNTHVLSLHMLSISL